MRVYLEERGGRLAAVREFFAKRQVLEVDTDILSKAAPVDAFIDVMRVEMGGGKTGYLHTSPEYGLKKLLAAGSGDIYQLSHVFRAEEEGPIHSPEFMMLEWYRVGMDYPTFIQETLELLSLFLGPLPTEILTYREAFLTKAGFDYTKIVDFLPIARSHNLSLSKEVEKGDRDSWLTLLFSHLVEPKLGQGRLTVITDYPSSQAALAKTAYVDGIEIACRFEVYYKGIELANGFDELTNAVEQRRRFHQENQQRLLLGKEELPIDEEFLEALPHLPPCCGVAVGFDRLLMLRLGESRIKYSPAYLTHP